MQIITSLHHPVCILPIPIHHPHHLFPFASVKVEDSTKQDPQKNHGTSKRQTGESSSTKSKKQRTGRTGRKGQRQRNRRENLEFQGNALGRESANKSSEGPNPPSFTCCSGHTFLEFPCEGCGDVVDLFRCRQDLLCSFSGSEHDGGWRKRRISFRCLSALLRA